MRYQNIECKIWNDEKFTKLTPMQQRLFLYFLTCPHGNFLGIFVLKPTWQKILTGALVFFICIGGLLIYYKNPRFYREDWRTAIKTL